MFLLQLASARREQASTEASASFMVEEVEGAYLWPGRDGRPDVMRIALWIPVVGVVKVNA